MGRGAKSACRRRVCLGSRKGFGQTALELAGQGEVDPELIQRTKLLEHDFEKEYQSAAELAKQAEIDRTLLAELETIRGGRTEERRPNVAEAFYVSAFRKAGLDLDKMSVDEAAAWLRARGNPVELATYVDDLWYERFLDRRPKESQQKLMDVANAADPDPWRVELRAKLGSRDAAAAAAFQRLADDEKALDEQPPISLLMLARGLITVRDPVRSERVLKHAWSRNPGDFWLNYNLALASGTPDGGEFELWRIFPRPQESIRYLATAVALRPLSVIARSELAMAQIANEEYPAALENLRIAVQTKPDYAPSYHILGNCLRASGDVDGALKAWRKAAQLDPRDTGCLVSIGGVSLDRGELDAALQTARDAISADPENVGGHELLGRVLLRRGDYDGSLESCLAAIRLAPGITNNSYAYLGELAFQGSDEQKARACEAMLQIAREYPNIPEYQARSALLLLVKKQDAQAYRKTVLAMRKTFGRLANPGMVYEYVRASLLDPRESTTRRLW